MSTTQTQTTTQYYAAVGTDGMRDVVWGVGPCADDAEAEALTQEGVPADLRYLPITAAAVEAVHRGAVGIDGRGGLTERGGAVDVAGAQAASETTASQIETLRTEAAAAGDTAQVDLCTAALAGDSAAWAACARAIRAARAMAD